MTYFPGMATLIIIALIVGYRFLIQNPGKKNEELRAWEAQRRDELKRMLENRQERTLLDEFDEDAFWEIIDKIQTRAKDGYNFHLGLLRDYMANFSPSELIRLDNLMHRLLMENISRDLTAASTIIFKNSDIRFTILLMNILIFKGQFFFRNACVNPNLIIGKELTGLEDRIISDVIADVYTRKTRELIPEIPEPETPHEIEGDPWTQNQLPSRYRELWEAFG